VNDSEYVLEKPRGARCLYVLAHGAGAGMRHPFLATTADRLESHKIATYRYEFPYMAEGKRRPDPPRIAQAAVREAVEEARRRAPGLPVIAGGKSFGGRMTSHAQAGEALPGVEGIVFLGFPLHAPGRDGDERAAHLFEVDIPMLFIQGTRDSLANLDLMRGVCARLGKRATLHIVEGGDHSFKVRKMDGREQSEVMDEIARAISGWVENTVGR
jgi:predicted alpha/beta-hydrolase family hydrolase